LQERKSGVARVADMKGIVEAAVSGSELLEIRWKSSLSWQRLNE